MENNSLKIIFTVVILVATIIGNAGPLLFVTVKWVVRLESMACGVFLGAGLTHLLNDAFEEFGKLNYIRYPVAPAVTIISFFLLTIVEFFSFSEHDARALRNKALNMNQKKNLFSEDNCEEDESDEDSNISKELKKTFKKMAGATISLYVIMAIHSIVEGIALGIMTKRSSLIAIFCAIVGHKPVEAFSLSLILLKDNPSKIIFWVLVCLYSLCSPIGIIAAHFLGSHSGYLALGLIASFSAGTFLFVACHEWTEMLSQKSIINCCEKIWHLFFFGLGVLWMLLIAILEMYIED
ncbi:ZIP Zinc transporter family protein [Histomonas meleagridis]|uniref:ZIP Zinc transporter family protein n=1 Tax=Histomonas meleagridis TaxID=135588 RepID=UPI003559DD74|nr:ZIP Zinc transporter family protein [Histomonas meleagridis]KAH0797226.1 ZIP Zinc transporter family protein [Histomonas meleagridis]